MSHSKIITITFLNVTLSNYSGLQDEGGLHNEDGLQLEDGQQKCSRAVTMELLMCGSISIVQAVILVKRDIDGVGTHSVCDCPKTGWFCQKDKLRVRW
jgi:hypothetical protein